MLKTSAILVMMLVTFNLFSQIKIENKTKLTEYKLIDGYADGPCNLKYYILEKADPLTLQKKVIDDCENLITKLIQLKQDAKKWKSQEFDCHDGCIGCQDITTMFEIEYNKYRDTIYYSYENHSILSLKDQKEYIDTERLFEKVINSNSELKRFNEIDFWKLSDAYRISIDDSLNVKDLKINNKNFYGLSRKETDSLCGGFDAVKTESYDYNDWSVSYVCQTSNQDSYNEYYFYKENPINKIIFNPIKEDGNQFPNLERLNVLGIKMDDDEKILVQKFPKSTRYLDFIKEFLKNEKGEYSTGVKLTNDSGFIEFVIKNEKIERIEIRFKYPKLNLKDY